MFERSTAERTKVRGEFNENKRKKQNRNNELFEAYFTDYQRPSSMYKKSSQVKGAVNEVWVESIKKVLRKLQRIIDYAPKDDAAKYDEVKIKDNEKIIDILERILNFNQLNQAAKGLKTLTPNQMLSRFSIYLAQLNSGNNSEKLKNEIRELLYSLYRPRKLTKGIYKSLVDII